MGAYRSVEPIINSGVSVFLYLVNELEKGNCELWTGPKEPLSLWILTKPLRCTARACWSTAGFHKSSITDYVKLVALGNFKVQRVAYNKNANSSRFLNAATSAIFTTLEASLIMSFIRITKRLEKTQREQSDLSTVSKTPRTKEIFWRNA